MKITIYKHKHPDISCNNPPSSIQYHGFFNLGKFWLFRKSISLSWKNGKTTNHLSGFINLKRIFFKQPKDYPIWQGYLPSLKHIINDAKIHIELYPIKKSYPHDARDNPSWSYGSIGYYHITYLHLYFFTIKLGCPYPPHTLDKPLLSIGNFKFWKLKNFGNDEKLKNPFPPLGGGLKET